MNADPVAEQKVLGSIIESAGGVLHNLNLAEEDFAAPAHQELWRAIHAYLDTGRPLTPTLLAAFVRDRQRTVLMPLIAECVGQVGTVHEAGWLAEGLRSLTARRRIEQASVALLQVANMAADLSPEEMAEAARAQVDRFTNRTLHASGSSSFVDAYLEGLERWGKPDTNVLPTGWRDLDAALTGGLRPGHLCVVASRPAIGKSLMGTELARQVASRGGRTLYQSLEMSRGEVADRITSSLSRVPLSTLTAGTATEDQLERLSEQVSRVVDWPLEIDARPQITVSGIRGRARDMTREGPLALVIVDYLQLVTPHDRKAPREQQVASISRGLKLLARDLEVPVVALAQINRSEGNNRPQMHNIRESGAIEADADEIWLLHRNVDVAPEDDDLDGQIEVNVVKNRHGKTGPVRLAWWPEGGSIRDLAR